MNTWSQVFLGVIAVATLTSAIVQVGILIAAALLARRIGRFVDRVERDLQPAFGHLNFIAKEGSRIVALAAAQVDRADRTLTDLTKRIDEVMTTAQASVIAPVREGKAVLDALRAAVDAVREARQRARARPRGDDEDALFI